MRNSMLDTGDAVSSGDNGGFGYSHPGVEIVKPKGEDVQFGAEPLPVDALVNAVRGRLAADPVIATDAFRIIVTREGRALLLNGTVVTSEAKEIAESVALGTPGVVDVVNRLVVKE